MSRAIMVLGLGVCSALGGAPVRADTGLRVGLGPDFGAPLGQRGQEVTTGLGAVVRLGYALRLARLELTPEAAVRFIKFGASPPGEGDADQNTLQVMGGARVGLGELVVPQLFVHLGYGLVKGEGSDYLLSHQGFTLASGLAVDLTLISWLRVGASAGYCAVFPDNAGHDTPYQWISFGAHVTAMF